MRSIVPRIRATGTALVAGAERPSGEAVVRAVGALTVVSGIALLAG